MTTPAKCPDCDGLGFHQVIGADGEWEVCEKCAGTGIEGGPPPEPPRKPSPSWPTGWEIDSLFENHDMRIGRWTPTYMPTPHEYIPSDTMGSDDLSFDRAMREAEYTRMRYSSSSEPAFRMLRDAPPGVDVAYYAESNGTEGRLQAFIRDAMYRRVGVEQRPEIIQMALAVVLQRARIHGGVLPYAFEFELWDGAFSRTWGDLTGYAEARPTRIQLRIPPTADRRYEDREVINVEVNRVTYVWLHELHDAALQWNADWEQRGYIVANIGRLLFGRI